MLIGMGLGFDHHVCNEFINQRSKRYKIYNMILKVELSSSKYSFNEYPHMAVKL